ncbi:DnaJ family domain-containing protein [Paenibacillus glycinis]|uniref:DUF1992 domain-containing protein n=1 Tax=Paenibacillus glycinis TaxID=2697035 RepID=A0ABW9XXN4_9BACL|nr:DnaJ family domain-containing protein [Paenibacillus glycinis]NBD27394.1 DUF1992 domain-containing protein [Paenibacillus glycinis]
MGFWFRKNKERIRSEGVQASSDPSEAIPGKVAEEQAASDAAVPSRQYWNSGMSVQDWMSEMFREQERKGAFEHLAGRGKPLDVPSGDVTGSILKEANFLPAWVTLQHEIRDQLQRLLETGPSVLPESALDEINAKITKYNGMVPSPMLQKWKLTRENMRLQYERWK